jgi:hypothetical protein
MPNLLLIGPTNNGKSMIVEKFRRMHPPVSHPDHEHIPVLAVQMPSEPSVIRFYVALLAAMGASLRPRQRLAELPGSRNRDVRQATTCQPLRPGSPSLSPPGCAASGDDRLAIPLSAVGIGDAVALGAVRALRRSAPSGSPHRGAARNLRGPLRTSPLQRPPRRGLRNIQSTLRYAEQADSTADAELRRWRRRRNRRP